MVGLSSSTRWGVEHAVRSSVLPLASTAVNEPPTVLPQVEPGDVPSPGSTTPIPHRQLAGVVTGNAVSAPHVLRRQPAAREGANHGGVEHMARHGSNVVDIERRGRPVLEQNEYQDRIVEGASLAFDRIEADPPELARLKSCALGMEQGLRSLGFAIAELMQKDVLLPAQLLMAQSEFAGIQGCINSLLLHDLVENNGHRAIVQALTGDLPEGA